MSHPTVAAGESNDGQGDRSDAATRSDLLEQWSDLTAFQRDLLAAISDADGRPYGLQIKESLTDAYGEEILHGRAYPNLDRLADQGLITKGARDKRTNEYALTSLGAAVLAVGADRLAAARSTPEFADLNTILESDIYADGN